MDPQYFWKDASNAVWPPSYTYLVEGISNHGLCF